ncbi:marine proteobacterial sortase target protein [Hahella sp. KA22]|uniref:marine proteobacterial sortase target protein n=1 Tax=Hahella sp. KA22 TaxID=1628392 RepID=UPI000FDEC15C|nr:marine proteobacterial sortase target protein [Hahella sp. KA22]AZZ89724.1 marine proteobacterial sortase target protein [Hahella sp. KA22]QAY53094.1 marine proteobacterial sortase target protein [Hahella sp. KA22]
MLNATYAHASLYRGWMVFALFLSTLCWTSLARAVNDDWSDVGSGELFFLANDASSPNYLPAVTLSTSYDANVAGLIATTEMTQTFRNDSQQWREAVYVFPLPEDAAVFSMDMQVGDRLIVGKIEEKQKAEKVYQQAKAEGKRAAVVHQQRPNLFTHKVANIGPGEMITLTLRYQQNIRYRAGAFSLALPLTVTPRYIPGSSAAPAWSEEDKNRLRNELRSHESTLINDSGWAPATDQVADAPEITPPTIAAEDLATPSHQARIRVHLNPGLPLESIESATHRIQWVQQTNGYEVSLESNKDILMDRDFTLTWRVRQGAEPEAALFKEVVGDDVYAQLLLMPPQFSDEGLSLPRELIWVIDTSGSMEGVSIQQAREALLQALDTLTPRDRFNVIEFNSSARKLFPQATPAQERALHQARRFVRGLKADGGTEIAEALDRALSDAAPEGYVRQVVFLTDGSVGNEMALFKQIDQQLGDSRLFTVGIGPSPNRFFMRKAAQFGRGTYRHISDTSEVSDKIAELSDALRQPALRDVRLDTPVTPNAEVYPLAIPDLYRGEPVQLLFKVEDGAGMSELPASIQGFGVGLLQDEQPLWSRSLDLQQAAPSQGVARAWARHKIDHWLDRKSMGETEESVRDTVLPLALDFALMSPYTSFVAVEETPARPRDSELESDAVPNLLPQGMSPNMARMPRTATASPLMIHVGVFCMTVAGLLGWRDIRELRNRKYRFGRRV